MNDKEIMENILITTKGVVYLYMHGTVESATPNVHGTFNTALNSALCMQSDVYKEMAERGWYPAEQATQQKLDAVKQKYAGIAGEETEGCESIPLFYFWKTPFSVTAARKEKSCGSVGTRSSRCASKAVRIAAARVQRGR